jgi:hypothetical protein
MASMQSIAQAMARRRKPPRRNFGVTGSIPGFGGVQRETQSQKIAEAKARHDDSGPYSHVPFQRPRRGRTRPTPGSSSNRNPRWN